MRKFKLFTFISGLISLLIAGVMAYVSYYVIAALVKYIANTGLESTENFVRAIFAVFIIPLMVIAILLCIFLFGSYLIFGINHILASFKKDETYQFKRGFIIFSIVLDFILVINLGIVAYGMKGSDITLYIGLGVILLGAILKIVDMILYKIRANKDEKNAVETPVEVNFDALKEVSTNSKEDKK